MLRILRRARLCRRRRRLLGSRDLLLPETMLINLLRLCMCLSLCLHACLLFRIRSSLLLCHLMSLQSREVLRRDLNRIAAETGGRRRGSHGLSLSLSLNLSLNL